jgi:hypothetical protein
MSVRNVYVEVHYTSGGKAASTTFSIVPDVNSVGDLVGKIEYQVNVRTWIQAESTTAQFGQIQIANNDGAYDFLVETDATHLTIKEVFDEDLAGATLLATSKIERIKYDDELITIVLKNKRKELDFAPQQELFPASEANSEFGFITNTYYSREDTRRPYWSGFGYSISPVLLRRTNNEYQVHSDEYFDIDFVLDNGIPVTFTDRGSGKFTLAADPTENGVLVCDGQGREIDGGASAANFTVDVLEGLFDDVGFTDFDSVELAAWKDRGDYVGGVWNTKCGFYLEPDDGTTFGELINWVCDSRTGYNYFDSLGELKFGDLLDPSGTADAELSKIDVLGDIKVIDDLAPNITTKAGGSRNWKVLRPEDLAASVTEQRAMELTQLHRETVDAVTTLDDFYKDTGLVHDTLIPGKPQTQKHIDLAVWLYRTKRRFYNITIADFYDIGSLINLTYPKADLDSGKLLRVVGYKIDFINEEYSLTLWG